PLVGGALIGAMLASAATAVLVVGRRSARTALLVGASALATGVAIPLAGMELRPGLAFLAGRLIAGIGFGASFNGSLRSVVPLAAPHDRAALMATFFAV